MNKYHFNFNYFYTNTSTYGSLSNCLLFKESRIKNSKMFRNFDLSVRDKEDYIFRTFIMFSGLSSPYSLSHIGATKLTTMLYE